MAGLGIAAWKLHSSQPMSLGFPIVLFALTSATWQLVFAVHRRAWAFWAAVAGALFAVGMGVAAGTGMGALVIAAGFLACLTAPGLAMIRQSKGA